MTICHPPRLLILSCRHVVLVFLLFPPSYHHAFYGVVEGWFQWPTTHQRQSTTNTVSIEGTDAQVHSHFMKKALSKAQEAERMGEVPIGALIVQRSCSEPNNQFIVLAEACNQVETRHDASAHAEMLAMRQAAQQLQNWRLTNTTLYTTLEPCPMCLAAAQAFRVSSIVYGAPDIRLGAIETHIKLLDIPHPFHTIDQIIPGVLGNESTLLLKDFFRRKRIAKTTIDK